MERINWIDWAKATAVCTVVLCHLPLPEDDFHVRYLQAGIITVFFFVSGYLKKDHGSVAANWRKYWRGLILPYLIYNLLFLPYWMAKFYMEHGVMPTGSDVMRPVIGALLAEHSASFCEPLNGPLWYLPAILFLHVVTDGLQKLPHRYWFILLLCVGSFVVYYVFRYYEWTKSMTLIGTVRRLPFYYLGYVMRMHTNLPYYPRAGFRKIVGRDHHVPLVSSTRPMVTCYRRVARMGGFLICLLLNILFFYWHTQETLLLPHLALFYPFNLCFLFTVLFGCKLVDCYAPRWMVNLSVGTLVVIGLHWMVIGGFIHVLCPLVGISWTANMLWYEALFLTALIVVSIYPIIVWSKRHMPVLLGKSKIV